MEIKEYNVVVIGGGAAGLMAAGTAAMNGNSVLLLEKMEKTGRKVRISGKGRCNLTNVCSDEEFLAKVQNGAGFFTYAYTQWGNRALMRFMERKGVKLETERGGRVFPKSGKAWDIAQALVDWCREEGVDVVCEAKVEDITVIAGKVRSVTYRNKRGFSRKVETPAVILATGGASYPATGSTGDGYRIAHNVGHTITPIRPSLVPLETSYEEAPYMAGLLLKNVEAKLVVDGEEVQSEFGEMLFSKRGVEGAIILRMSRKAVDALIDEKRVEVVVDLKHAMDHDELRERILREIAEQPSTITVGELLRKIMPRELVVPMAKACGAHAKHSVGELKDEKIERLVDALKHFVLPISDYRPFEEAIVTAGGVDLAEIDPHTMQSRRVEGLYFAGELMDIDANTGGYNLQIAFSTGRLAGQLRKSKDVMLTD